MAGVLGNVAGDKASSVNNDAGHETGEEGQSAVYTYFTGNETSNQADKERDKESQHGIAEDRKSQGIFN